MICRVCLKPSEGVLNIFDDKKKENIADIIQQHFWFQPLRNDPVSTVICCDCWTKISYFHQFYGTVEQAHEFLQLVTDEISKAKKSKVVSSSELLDEIITVKEEFVDNVTAKECPVTNNPQVVHEVLSNALSNSEDSSSGEEDANEQKTLECHRLSSISGVPTQVSGNSHNNDGEHNTIIDASMVTTNEWLISLSHDMSDLKQNQANLTKLIKETLGLCTADLPLNETKEEIWLHANIPITTADTLHDFDEKLANPVFQETVVKMFSKYTGTDGKKNGKTSGYKIIDLIVKRHVVDLYTWTGSSKVKGVVKLPFLKLQNFVHTIFKILFLSDRAWDEMKNEEFLQCVIKHSKRRLEEEQHKMHSDRKRRKPNESSAVDCAHDHTTAETDEQSM